jgi:hypothetical protein
VESAAPGGRTARTAPATAEPGEDFADYWSLTPGALAQRLGCGTDGLDSAAAARRLQRFRLLLGAFDAGVEVFRTSWLVESLITELVVALLIRTRRPFYRSRPGTRRRRS